MAQKQTRKALLVVDVQNDFCPGGALAVPDGDKVVEPINLMIGRFSKESLPVFFSIDWHPPNTEHFRKWPPHCVAATQGALLHKDLKWFAENHYVIFKGESGKDDGYSPFEGRIFTDFPREWKSFEEILKLEKIEEIYICGLATDYCVKAAVLDALGRGFKVFVIPDACRAVNISPDDGEKALREMAGAGAVLSSTGDILKGF